MKINQKSTMLNPRTKEDIASSIIGNKREIIKNRVEEYAPTNFALVKYWGKQNEELMIPYTNSFSISLGKLFGTKTILEKSNVDELVFDGVVVDSTSGKFTKLFKFLDLFRKKDDKFRVITCNSLATDSGLATSASGFASIVKCLNSAYDWHLSKKELSILARLGSGSASRSIYDEGFVELVVAKDGVYSYARPFKYALNDIYLGILQISSQKKAFSSSEGMKKTMLNSLLYQQGWKRQVNHDLKKIKKAIIDEDYLTFFRIMQSNSLAMHAAAISAGVIYWSEETLSTIKHLLELQGDGVEIYFTEDAGENLKILTHDYDVAKKYFPDVEFFKIL